MPLKKISLYAMSVFYIVAGINHFVHPSLYRKIIPFYLPWHSGLVYTSGICETGLAILLLIKETRVLAAWGIILLLIAIFPANIQMMQSYMDEHNPHLWITILRLPIQFVLIWWAYSFTKK